MRNALLIGLGLVLLLAAAVFAACGNGDGGGGGGGGPSPGSRRGDGQAADAAAERFLSTYVTPEGRVARHDEGGDTVSEGQSYALLLAAGRGDEQGFDRIWTWTRENLQRDDGLFAWRWQDGRVVDEEPAADADLDIAAALLLAADRFEQPELEGEARRIADAVMAEETVEVGGARLLVAGPWAVGDRIVNPSYLARCDWDRFADLTGDEAWSDMGHHGLDMLAGFAETGLPPDWARVAEAGDAGTADAGTGEASTGGDAGDGDAGTGDAGTGSDAGTDEASTGGDAGDGAGNGDAGTGSDAGTGEASTGGDAGTGEAGTGGDAGTGEAGTGGDAGTGEASTGGDAGTGEAGTGGDAGTGGAGTGGDAGDGPAAGDAGTGSGPGDGPGTAAFGDGAVATAVPSPDAGEGPGRYGLDAARIPVRMAACDEGAAVAAGLWEQLHALDGEGAAIAYALDGARLEEAENPLGLVAGAAAAQAAGDPDAGRRLLDAAADLDRATPTYYGAAWLAFGEALAADAATGDAEAALDAGSDQPAPGADSDSERDGGEAALGAGSDQPAPGADSDGERDGGEAALGAGSDQPAPDADSDGERDGDEAVLGAGSDQPAPGADSHGERDGDEAARGADADADGRGNSGDEAAVSLDAVPLDAVPLAAHGPLQEPTTTLPETPTTTTPTTAPSTTDGATTTSDPATPTTAPPTTAVTDTTGTTGDGSPSTTDPSTGEGPGASTSTTEGGPGPDADTGDLSGSEAEQAESLPGRGAPEEPAPAERARRTTAGLGIGGLAAAVVLGAVLGLREHRSILGRPDPPAADQAPATPGIGP